MAYFQKMWGKLQAKEAEESTATGSVPVGGDDPDVGDPESGFKRSLEKSLAAQTSKSHRYQPYSG